MMNFCPDCGKRSSCDCQPNRATRRKLKIKRPVIVQMKHESGNTLGWFKDWTDCHKSWTTEAAEKWIEKEQRTGWNSGYEYRIKPGEDPQ